MSLIKRILDDKYKELRSEFSISMPGSEQDSGVNSIEKQIDDNNPSGDESNRNEKELKRFRKFRAEELIEKGKKKRDFDKKLLSKQPILPKSIQSQLNREKRIKNGEDNSPII